MCTVDVGGDSTNIRIEMFHHGIKLISQKNFVLLSWRSVVKKKNDLKVLYVGILGNFCSRNRIKYPRVCLYSCIFTWNFNSLCFHQVYNEPFISTQSWSASKVTQNGQTSSSSIFHFFFNPERKMKMKKGRQNNERRGISVYKFESHNFQKPRIMIII